MRNLLQLRRNSTRPPKGGGTTIADVLVVALGVRARGARRVWGGGALRWASFGSVPVIVSGGDGGVRMASVERSANAAPAAPKVLNDVVHRQMRRMPRTDTKPEIELRRELFARGLRFRKNYRGLPGQPDIAFTRAHIAVFIDGCFWHGCSIHGSVPRNNHDWWAEKLRKNRERDRKKDLELEELGWLPLHYWEHDDVDDIADEIEEVWRDLTGRG